MDERPSGVSEDDAFWRDYLTNGDPRERRLRRLLSRLPHGPRCQLCAGPFHGPGGAVMRLVGKGPSAKDPSICNQCFSYIAKRHGGAEVEASFLFADVRGSTTLAEGMSASAFRGLLDRFYRTASDVVFAHDGGLDKFVGDEVVAFFFPRGSDTHHAVRAVNAALDLLRATGHEDRGGPWLPIGAGVATGPAWVGALGNEAHTEMTAVGDIVNTAARLAARATAGEILVTAEAARAASVDPALERRVLELKGKAAGTEVVSLTVAPRPAEAAAS